MRPDQPKKFSSLRLETFFGARQVSHSFLTLKFDRSVIMLSYVYLSSYSAQPILLNLRDCLRDQVYSLMCTGFQHVLCFIYLTLICPPAYSGSILPT